VPVVGVVQVAVSDDEVTLTVVKVGADGATTSIIWLITALVLLGGYGEEVMTLRS